MIEQHERQTLRPGAPRPECNLSQNRPERREVLGPHLLLASLIAHRTREGSTLFNHGSSPPRTIRRKEIQGDADLEVSADRPEWIRILLRFVWYTGASLLCLQSLPLRSGSGCQNRPTCRSSSWRTAYVSGWR